MFVDDKQSTQLYKREQKSRRFMGDTVSSQIGKAESVGVKPNNDLLHD
jgi:hypothetical protein